MLAERDPITSLVLLVLAEHRRDLEIEDLKALAVWTANATRAGKAP